MSKPQYPGLYYFDTFTFTTLGTSGSRGPDVTKGYANAPWRDGDFYIQDGQQHWTVPANGTYQITAAGAYGATPGRVVTGQVKLNEGQTVKLLVGQCPSQLTANVQDNVTIGGGGGTFVVTDKPLIVASGGDGGQFTTTYNLFQTFPGPIISSTLSGDGNTLLTVVDKGSGNPRGLVYFYTRQANSWVQKIYQIIWPRDPFIIESIKLDYTGKTLLIGMPLYNYAGVSKYTNNQWSSFNQLPAGAASNKRFGGNVALSSDGNTAIVSTQLSTYRYVSCFRFNGTTWTGPTVITSTLGNNIGVNGDGTVVVVGTVGTTGLLSNAAVFRYSGGTWDSGTFLTPPLALSSLIFFGTSVSISNDGNSVLVGATATALNITGEYASLYTYNGSTWSNSFIYYPPLPYWGFATKVALSGDGTTAFVSAPYGLNGGYVAGFKNGGPAILCQISYAPSFGLQLCTMYTGNEVFAAADYTNDFNGIFTYTVSQSATFLPSGDGSGKQGAGYLTDGLSTDPYFGFLKPRAYVSGGFGNAYEYGSVPEQGGFGGGQSPLVLQNQIALISGNAFVRPVLTASTIYLSLVKLSYDGNVCMTYDFTGDVYIFRFAGGAWSSSTTISSGRTLTSISLSWDGNVALFGGSTYAGVRIYSGGSWGVATQLTNSASSVALSGDGLTALIGTSSSASVFRYSGGSWGTATVIQAPASQVALNFNGTKAVLNANVYQYSSGVWTRQVQLSTDITSFSSCSISDDGSRILISETRGRTFLFNTTTGTNTQLSNNYGGASLSSDGNFYMIANRLNAYGNTYTFSPIPVQISGVGGYITTIRGSNVFALWSPGGSNVWFGNVTSPYTPVQVTTVTNHNYPYNYTVQIQGTNGYDGTWPITVTGLNTFTFNGFGGIYGTPETAGFINGPVTGISGGGGYSGSPGDGVSGATCYADTSVTGFTDLGASSNTSGYVTVSLVDPKPLTETWSWDDESPWEYINSFQSNAYTVTWCESLGIFAVKGFAVTPSVSISSDTKQWKQINISIISGFDVITDRDKIVSATDRPIIICAYKVTNDGINWYDGNFPRFSYFSDEIAEDILTIYTNGMFIRSMSVLVKTGYYFEYRIYTSSDGVNWSLVYSDFNNYVIVQCYNNPVYVGLRNYEIVYSSDLIHWTGTGITKVFTITFGETNFVAVSYGNGGVYTSLDGIHWSNLIFVPITIYSFIMGGVPFQIVFGNGLFIMTDQMTNYMYTSKDSGVTWTQYDHSALGSVTSMTYAPKLGIFMIIAGYEYYLTLDGQYLVSQNTAFFKAAPLDCEWSPQTQTLVVTTVNTGLVYTQTDTWHVTSITSEKIGYAWVVWSPELGKFFLYFNVLNQSNYFIRVDIYTSLDGLQWEYQNNYLVQPFSKPVWSKEKGIFTNGNIISRDGIYWVDSTPPLTNLIFIFNDFGSGYEQVVNSFYSPWTLPQALSYSSTLGIFVGNTGYSYDGHIWFPSSQNFKSVAWSSSLKLFVGVNDPASSFYGPQNFVFYTSSDGITWNLVTVSLQGFLTQNDLPWSGRGVVWSNELQKFFIYYPILFGGDPGNPANINKLLIESTDGITWTVREIQVLDTSYTQNFFWFGEGFNSFIVTPTQTFKIDVSPKALKQF